MNPIQEVIEDEFFGNLTVKGIKEITFVNDWTFTPLTWGWYALILLTILTVFWIKQVKKKRVIREKLINDSISFVNRENTNVVDAISSLKICLNQYSQESSIEALSIKDKKFKVLNDDQLGLVQKLIYRHIEITKQQKIEIKSNILKAMEFIRNEL